MPGSTPSWPGHQPDNQRISGGIAFGSTGSDLHAAVPRPIGGKVIATLGIALAVAVVLLGVLGGAYYMKKQQAPVVLQQQPSATAATTGSAPPPPLSAATTASADPPASATASADSSAKPPKVTRPVGGRPKGNPGRPPVSPGTATPGKPVDPTGDRF
jgi:hypothetical protein